MPQLDLALYFPAVLYFSLSLLLGFSLTPRLVFEYETILFYASGLRHLERFRLRRYNNVY